MLQRFPAQPLNVCDPRSGRYGQLRLRSVYWFNDYRAIPYDFRWEASVPKLARSLFYGAADPKLQLASLDHDARSLFHEEDWTRQAWADANAAFRMHLERAGVNAFKRAAAHASVSLTESYWRNTEEDYRELFRLACIRENQQVLAASGNVFNFPRQTLELIGM